MISKRLKNTILKQLNLKDFDFQDGTVANHVPGWDSLSHVGIILAIENEFKVRLKTIDVLRCKNVGDLQKLLDNESAHTC